MVFCAAFKLRNVQCGDHSIAGLKNTAYVLIVFLIVFWFMCFILQKSLNLGRIFNIQLQPQVGHSFFGCDASSDGAVTHCVPSVQVVEIVQRL